MANKKSAAKKSTREKTIITKIAGQAGQFAGELIAGKDHLVEIAGNVFESVKSSIQTITAKKKTAPKKSVLVRAKRTATKSTGRTTKKAARPVAGKKTSPPKKSNKKV